MPSFLQEYEEDQDADLGTEEKLLQKQIIKHLFANNKALIRQETDLKYKPRLSRESEKPLRFTVMSGGVRPADEDNSDDEYPSDRRRGSFVSDVSY